MEWLYFRLFRTKTWFIYTSTKVQNRYVLWCRKPNLTLIINSSFYLVNKTARCWHLYTVTVIHVTYTLTHGINVKVLHQISRCSRKRVMLKDGTRLKYLDYQPPTPHLHPSTHMLEVVTELFNNILCSMTICSANCHP